MSKWSEVVKGKTEKSWEELCVWKECPDHIREHSKYSLNKENPRIATKISENWDCAIIGNTFIPPNKVTSWNIKLLKSRDNSGFETYIGVAPFYISQDDDHNFDKCGWYFCCFDSECVLDLHTNIEVKEYEPK